jgi:glycosyltransferase involved in cell wall biosynthesis
VAPPPEKPAGARRDGVGKRLLLNVNVAWFLISHRLPVLRAARDAGYDVHVAGSISSEQEVALLESEGATFHRMALGRGSLNPLRDLGYLMQLLAVIRKVKPDLIHNITVKPIVYGSIAARVLRVRGIVNAVSGLGYAFTGGGSRRWLSFLVRTAYRVAVGRPGIRVIFQNPDDMGSFATAGVIGPGQGVLIRGSGVDLEAFQPGAEPPGTPRVVLPARMLRDKGVVEFATAARLIRERGRAASFVLAGMIDEANPASLRQGELAELSRETGVEWMGHVENVPALYRGAHIVCLPSYREGMPKALIEACAAGWPIVTTDVVGCREVVADGVNGLLVKARDAESLATALQRLLDDPSLRARLGSAGRQRAMAEFDVKAVVGATLDLYGQVLGSP